MKIKFGINFPAQITNIDISRQGDGSIIIQGEEFIKYITIDS